MIDSSRLRWSPVSILLAVTVSILSGATFLLLEIRGYTFTDITGFETVTSSLAGGLVLWWRHPKTWWLVILFYVPVMSVLLVVGGVIVVGRFGYRFET